MALTYGTEGIKQKDYRVYLDSSTAAGVAEAVATYVGSKTKANINTLIGTLDELGECRRVRGIQPNHSYFHLGLRYKQDPG